MAPGSIRDPDLVPLAVENAFFAHVFAGLVAPTAVVKGKLFLDLSGSWIKQPTMRLSNNPTPPLRPRVCGPLLVNHNERTPARWLTGISDMPAGRIPEVSDTCRRGWQGWLAEQSETDRRGAEAILARERTAAVASLPSWDPAPVAQVRPAPASKPALAPKPTPAPKSTVVSRPLHRYTSRLLTFTA